MDDNRKTKAELIAELNDLRQQVAKLQGSSLFKCDDREDYLQSIVDALPVYISYVDANHHYKFINKLYEQWLNKPGEQIIGQHLRTIVGEDGYAQAMPYLDKAFSGSPVTYETTLKEKDGIHIYEVNHTPDIQEGAVQGIFVLVTDITERKRLEEQERQEKDFAEGIIDTAHAIVLVLDSEGRIVRFNPYMEKITGYKLQEVKGKDWFTSFLPKQEHERIRALFTNAIDGNKTLGNVNPILTKDGHERIIEWYDTTLKNSEGNTSGLLAIGQDITDRLEAERDRYESEAKYHRLMESAGDAILLADNRRNLIDANQRAEQLLGYTKDEILKLNVADIHPREELENTLASFDHMIREGVGSHMNGHVLRKDGTKVPVDITGSFIDIHGRKIGMGIFRDISQRITFEQTLIEAKEQAEEANQAKSKFLSRMSHELRTPLNSLLGFAQLLEMGDDTINEETRSQYLNQIAKSGWHLLDLVNDVLDLAKIEASKIELNIEEVDINERILDSIRTVQPLADDRDILFEYPDDMACPEMHVLADALRLKQVLLNLLSNAIKYNREAGSVIVRCYSVMSGRVRISVTDTGSGIPEADMPNLFEPFSRLYLKTYAQEGTGIGLALSKQLIELMGGAIGVESEQGKGSTFWIELEGCQPIDHEVDRIAEETNVAEDLSTKEYDLLYIEDSPSHIKLMEAIISLLPGYRLRTAHTPRLGLELAFSRPPDLILLDICLPDMDGYQVLEKIQQNKATKNLPVVALTANAMPHEVEKGLRAGFRRYIIKPINVKELRRALGELLQDMEVHDS